MSSLRMVRDIIQGRLYRYLFLWFDFCCKKEVPQKNNKIYWNKSIISINFIVLLRYLFLTFSLITLMISASKVSAVFFRSKNSDAFLIDKYSFDCFSFHFFHFMNDTFYQFQIPFLYLCWRFCLHSFSFLAKIFIHVLKVRYHFLRLFKFIASFSFIYKLIYLLQRYNNMLIMSHAGRFCSVFYS